MTLRILHFSDIHFGGENVRALAAAQAYARSAPFDLLVISGDLTQTGSKPQFAAARSWIAGLPLPVMALPGNHDTPWLGLIQRVFAPFGRFERSIGPAAECSFENEKLAVRAFNSARGWQLRMNWSKGSVSRGQAERAARALEAAQVGALRIATCHHPLLEAQGEPMTALVHGGRRAAEILVKAGADIILTGHLHAPFVEALPFGDNQTFAVGAGTLSLRQRGVPPGFNVLEVAGDQLTVKALGWVDPELTTQNTWVVKLRARMC